MDSLGEEKKQFGDTNREKGSSCAFMCTSKEIQISQIYQQRNTNGWDCIFTPCCFSQSILVFCCLQKVMLKAMKTTGTANTAIWEPAWTSFVLELSSKLLKFFFSPWSWSLTWHLFGCPPSSTQNYHIPLKSLERSSCSSWRRMPY